MRRWTLSLGLPALFFLASSCASGSAMEDTSPYDASERDAHAEVQNDHQLDVRVFALRYGEAERLGTVTSHTRQSFELPSSWVNTGVSLALRVEPIGGAGEFTTREFVLEPGSVIELTVRNFLSTSTVRIR